MEFGTREILILLGILVILAILLDGIRRVRRARYGKLRIARRRQPIFDDQDINEYGSELPSGGARVVQVRDEESTEKLSEQIRRQTELTGAKVTTAYRMKPQRQVSPGPQPTDEPSGDRAPRFESPETGGAGDSAEEITEESTGESTAETTGEGGENIASRAEPTFDMPGTDSKAGNTSPRPEKPAAAPEPRREPPRGGATSGKPEKKAAAAEPEEMDVLVLHVMARKGERFDGEPLLQQLLDNGLRYGSMKIFHRHANPDGSGPILFSAANSVNPGTFDLNAMTEFSTPGITFFMTLNGLESPMEAFDELLDVVYTLARELDGEVKDETRSAMTRQTIEHYRQRIIEHTRRSFTLSH
jgi:cell division protein ZipA